MLSISGLHVAVIAAAMELLFQVARMSRRVSVFGAFVTTGIYVAVIGAPPPALRSAGMLGVSMASRLSQRPTSPWAAWALGAFVPLVQPRIAMDVGYQLSVLGMCALVAAGSLWRRHLARRVAAPVITLAQPILFLALLVSPLGALARFLAQAVHPLLFAFDWIAWAAASAPGAAMTVTTTLITALLAALAAAALVIACASRYPARPAIIGLAALATMVVLPALSFSRSDGVEVHFLDVGQGDAILIRTNGGHWVLLDAGPAWRGGDAGRTTVLPYILRRGGSLEAFVLSHPHTDHVGGAASVLTAMRPRTYWDAAFAGGSESYIASLAAARKQGMAIQSLSTA